LHFLELSLSRLVNHTPLKRNNSAYFGSVWYSGAGRVPRKGPAKTGDRMPSDNYRCTTGTGTGTSEILGERRENGCALSFEVQEKNEEIVITCLPA
jgi:hypothetical protein